MIENDNSKQEHGSNYFILRAFDILFLNILCCDEVN